MHLQLLGAPSHPTLFSLARCTVSSLCPSHKLHGMGFKHPPRPSELSLHLKSLELIAAAKSSFCHLTFTDSRYQDRDLPIGEGLWSPRTAL